MKFLTKKHHSKNKKMQLFNLQYQLIKAKINSNTKKVKGNYHLSHKLVKSFENETKKL
jgi:hypothetical protein